MASAAIASEPSPVLRTLVSQHALELTTAYEPVGCKLCNGSGYRGRIGIFEILPVSSFLASLIAKGTDSQTLKNRAKEEGMTTMMEDGLQKAVEGVTTLEEVVRVAYGS